jgi:molybdate/tungstate transport system substrate-binding protein
MVHRNILRALYTKGVSLLCDEADRVVPETVQPPIWKGDVMKKIYSRFSRSRGKLNHVKECLILILIIICLGGTFTACRKNGEKKQLHVLHAGSLSVPFKQMADAFMKKYPDVEVTNESHGSRVCARQITELGSTADVMASADSAVIRTLLIPDYAEYCIDFTTNEMVIMYEKDRKFTPPLTKDNWYELLVSGDYEYGHSEPNADPCGYRTRLCWQLAEHYYNVPGLYENLITHCPEKNIRSKEVDLLALLEAGELDMIFIYRSVAQQHDGGYLLLPDEINLKSGEYADFYSKAEIELTGSKPGETIIRKGAPMVYGITVPATAASPELGVAFVEFVLGKQGREIMATNGQPEIIPPLTDNMDALPEKLKTFFK